jgi:hypothetical protein
MKENLRIMDLCTLHESSCDNFAFHGFNNTSVSCVSLLITEQSKLLSPEATLVLKSDHIKFYSIHIHQSRQRNAIMSR